MPPTQDQAQQSLNTGGLQGSDLSAASSVLDNYYKNQNPQPPQTPASPDTTSQNTTTQPQPAANPDITQRDQAQKQLDSASTEFQRQAQQVQDTITNIQNGSIPLTTGENAQIDALKAQYGQLIDQQVLSNTNSSGVGNIRGYQTGSAEYDPTFQAKVIGSIITAGVQKVATLNTQMAGAVAQLTQGFKDSDISAVKDAWGVYEDAAKERTDTLQKVVDDANTRLQALQEAQQKAQEQTQKDLSDLSKTALSNGAPPDMVSAILNAPDLATAVQMSGPFAAGGTGIIGEYNRYVADAALQGHVPLSFSDYQDMDANRKRSIVNVNGGGLTSREQQTYLSITNKYQADPIINAAIKAGQINQVADAIIADPNSTANQLSSLYLYVKNLDPDSAVREGELGLANSTQSYLQKYQTQLTRLSKGQVISPQAAKDLAIATKALVGTWQTTADKKTKLYQSQAKNSSPAVGDAFSGYISDYNDSNTSTDITNDETTAQNAVVSYGSQHPEAQPKIRQLAGVVQPDLGRAYTWAEIGQILGIQ